MRKETQRWQARLDVVRRQKARLDLDAILQALRGDDALVILRRLADRDPQWAKVIETMAKDLLSVVDAAMWRRKSWPNWNR